MNVAGYAAKSNSSDEKDPVPLREIKEYDESEKPRGLFYPPLQCYFCKSSIQFVFYSDLGNVDIIITNQSTGERYVDGFDTLVGMRSVDISGSSGVYYIEINTENGMYVGIYNY